MDSKVPRAAGDFFLANEPRTATPSFRPTTQAPANSPARPITSPLPDPLALQTERLGTEEFGLTDGLTSATPREPAGLGSSTDRTPVAPFAGADSGQQPSAAPDAGFVGRGSADNNVVPSPAVAASSQPDAATLALMLGAGLGAASRPTPVTAGGAVLGVTGGGGSGGPLVNSHSHGRPRDRHGDPLWVLDANDRIVLPDASTVPAGYAINTFSGWSMDLLAQVSGATVSSYSWSFGGNLNDFTQVTGQTSYNLQFTWRSFSGNNDSDTVSLTVNTDQGQDSQTFKFNVLSTSNPANQGSRPTLAPSFPLVIPPDAVKPGQEMIGQPYYSLGEQTGEVRTSFALPSYDPGITPLQLDYSSLAANPQPIFTDYYQLTQPIQPNSTVTAALKLNGVSQGTSTYDTHLLNPGDILDIALQGNAASLSTGRYPYEMDVTENGTAQTPQTGYVDIVNESSGPFGAGWSLDNVDQLVPVSGGAILVLPYGQSLWFASSSQYFFTTPPGDFTKLVQNSNDLSYSLTLKDQTTVNFNLSGYQTSIVEPTTNNTFTFSYNPNVAGQLVSITDYENRVLTLAYNGSATVKTITDPDMVGAQTYRTLTLGYDSHHTRLTSLTGPDPSLPNYPETIPVYQYTYDASAELSTLKDPRRNVYTFAYNFAGRINTVSRPDGSNESLAAQQLNGLQDPNNPDETPVLAVQAVADYSDPRSTPNSNPPNPIDWLVATDWFGYGYGLQHYDPLNDLTTDRRDGNGLTWLAEDPLSRPTRTFYDQAGKIALPAPQGDPTEIALPDAYTVGYTYNNYNESLTYADPNGDQTGYGYGGTDGTPVTTGSLLTDVQCPCGTPLNPQPGEYQLSYNRRGYQDTFTDPNSHVVTMGYGTYAAPTRIQYPPDATGGTAPTVNATYNGAGDPLTYEDPLAHTTSYMPDNLGRILSQTAPTGGQISYAYDAAGNPLSLEDPAQNLTQYQYDPMNRVSAMIAPGTLTTTYIRDADGNVTDIIDPDILPDGNHRDRHFIYDNAGRLTTEQWLDGTSVTYQANYTYDAASELISASDQTGGGATISSYTLTYDVRGRLASTQENNIPGVSSVTLTVQYDGNGNRTSIADNLPQPGTIAYSYDPGSLPAIEGMFVNGANDQVVTFLYDTQDPEHRLTGIQRSASGTNWANTTYSYTNRNLVNSIQDSYPNGSANFNYTYDLDGQVQTYSGPDGSLSYGYDSTGQLTVVYGSHPETYSYDLNGNRETANGQTYGMPGPANQLTSDGVYTYTYDNVGNMLTKTGLENGIPTVYSFTWDFQNRLKEVKKTQNSGMTILADDTFTYDVFGQRIGKVDKNGNQVWTVYDGGNPYADFTGVASLALSARYLYGPGADQLLASTDANGNNTVWYLTDLQGSVRRVVGNSGSAKANLAYDSFGNIISGTPYNRFTYAGREWDSEIGLYSYRARYYDPSTGRFVSQDPVQFQGGQANTYAYVANQPTDLKDPTGHGFWSVVGGAVGGAIVATVVVVTFPVSVPVIVGAGIVAGGAVVGGVVGNALYPDNPAAATGVGGAAGGAFALVACYAWAYGPAAWEWLVGGGGGAGASADQIKQQLSQLSQRKQELQRIIESNEMPDWNRWRSWQDEWAQIDNQIDELLRQLNRIQPPPPPRPPA